MWTDILLTGLYFCVLVFLVIVIFIGSQLWRGYSECKELSQTYDMLCTNACTLGLRVVKVDGNCMFAALVDQLSVKCPKGNYSIELLKRTIKHQAPSDFKQGVASIVRRRLSNSVKHSDWLQHVDKLQAVADAINRVIEIVHGDRRETTVIRPHDMQVGDSIMVLYIGRCCRGFYYSLRLSNTKLKEKKTNDSSKLTHSVVAVNTNTDHSYVNETGAESNDVTIKEDVESDCLLQNNVLIGNNCQQYVINSHNFNAEGSSMQNNTVNGIGNTQKVLVYMESSEDLKSFLLNKKFHEGEIPSLHMKIRQRAGNAIIKKEEQTLIKSLNRTDSSQRAELDKILHEYDLSFDKAMEGCILMKLRAKSMSSFLSFVDKFNCRKLGNFIRHVLRLLPLNNDISEVIINFELSINSVSNQDEPKNGLNLRTSNTLDHLKCTEETTLSKGISIHMKEKHLRKCEENSKTNISRPIKRLEEIVERSMLAMLHDQRSSNEYDNDECHFQAYEFGPNLTFAINTRSEMNQNYLNRLFESVNGFVGVVTVNHKKSICFKVGNNYIFSAGHMFYNCNPRSIIQVQFPNQNSKPARLEYLCNELDFAVLCVVGNIYKTELFHYQLLPSVPGLSIDFIFTRDGIASKPLAERAVVLLDTVKCNAANYIILESAGKIGPGWSGSPGVSCFKGKLYISVILLGEMMSEHRRLVGLKMTDVISHLKYSRPELARKLCISSPVQPPVL